MKFALVNPNWDFQGSIYFGCPEPHLPLEYGYARALLEKAGHEVALIDGHLYRLTLEQIRRRIAFFQPDFTVITTAPSYLFWRCPQPELRVPQQTAGMLRECSGMLIAVGPHGSTTPEAVLKKLDIDALLLGEFEELLPQLCSDMPKAGGSSICFKSDRHPANGAVSHSSDMKSLPALRWPERYIRLHAHHHHRFDRAPHGPGAEMETSRGCPYQCLFCAKENFRNKYRKRPIEAVCEELDGLLGQGVGYIYFIDELFIPDTELLLQFKKRKFCFGLQTRIDLWNESQLELLGSSGCVSLEAGIESITDTGRKALHKKALVPEEDLIRLLAFAKRHIPFVQANLIAMQADQPDEVSAWRADLQSLGIWANKPVPVFPYPGSPLYRTNWGEPDSRAWERAHEQYLESWQSFSDIQHERPVPLPELEFRIPYE